MLPSPRQPPTHLVWVVRLMLGEKMERSPRLQQRRRLHSIAHPRQPCGSERSTVWSGGVRWEEEKKKAPISSSRSACSFFSRSSEVEDKRLSPRENRVCWSAGKRIRLPLGAEPPARTNPQTDRTDGKRRARKKNTHTATRNPEMRVELPAAHADGRKKKDPTNTDDVLV